MAFTQTEKKTKSEQGTRYSWFEPRDTSFLTGEIKDMLRKKKKNTFLFLQNCLVCWELEILCIFFLEVSCLVSSGRLVFKPLDLFINNFVTCT